MRKTERAIYQTSSDTVADRHQVPRASTGLRDQLGYPTTIVATENILTMCSCTHRRVVDIVLLSANETNARRNAAVSSVMLC